MQTTKQVFTHLCSSRAGRETRSVCVWSSDSRHFCRRRSTWGVGSRRLAVSRAGYDGSPRPGVRHSRDKVSNYYTVTNKTHLSSMVSAVFTFVIHVITPRTMCESWWQVWLLEVEGLSSISTTLIQFTSAILCHKYLRTVKPVPLLISNCLKCLICIPFCYY